MPRLVAGGWIWQGAGGEGGNWGLGFLAGRWEGAPVTSAPSWMGLQLMFAEHTLCVGGRPCPLAAHNPLGGRCSHHGHFPDGKTGSEELQ